MIDPPAPALSAQFAGQKLASIESTGEIKYYHSDLRGSAKYVTDDFGNVLKTRLYKPYGQEYQSSGSSGYLPYRFNDRRDETNGTLRFPLRNLSDKNYHWTALDPIIRTNPSASVKNIGNPFSYAGYDPVNNIDLMGAANIPIFRPIPLPSQDSGNDDIYEEYEDIITTVTITAERPDQSESSGSESGSETIVVAAVHGDPFGFEVETGDSTTWVPIGVPFAGGIFSGISIVSRLAVRGAVALGRAGAFVGGVLGSLARRIYYTTFNFASNAAARGAQQAFNVTGRLQTIWQNPRLFTNWLKGSHSLSRIGNPLTHAEARQVLQNAQRLGLKLDLNVTGLRGLEQTGRWAGIPHFKIGNVHIPVLPGFMP